MNRWPCAASFHQKYAATIDRESAYEKLAAKASKEAQEKEQKEAEKEEAAADKAAQKRSPGRPRKSSLEKAKDSFLSSLFRTIAREIAKLIMGSLNENKPLMKEINF